MLANLVMWLVIILIVAVIIAFPVLFIAMLVNDFKSHNDFMASIPDCVKKYMK